MNYIEVLRRDTRLLREQLMAHPVYQMVDSVDNLRVFMEHHVFAVWDFMSLLKRLQQLLTGVGVPWLPKSQRTAARLINEIVLGEETDEDGFGGYISHFDLYREAMLECGACTDKMDSLARAIARGFTVDGALSASAVEPGVAAFVRTTFSFVASQKAHCVAAAFTFGREDVIPDMFRQCVAALGSRPGNSLERMQYYLARHIELDEETHAPMAIQMMRDLCGEDEGRWREATDAVAVAIRSRIALWDAIVVALEANSVLSGVPAEPKVMRNACIG